MSNISEADLNLLRFVYRQMLTYDEQAEQLSDAVHEILLEQVTEKVNNNPPGTVTILDAVRWAVLDTVEHFIGKEAILEFIEEAQQGEEEQ